MHLPSALLLGFIISLVPAQTRQASRVQINTGKACQYLDDAECCAQTLKTAGFEARGEMLPARAKTTVSLSCQGPERTLPAAACRSIMASRGFGPAEVKAACAAPKQAKGCNKNSLCRKCKSELRKLSYRNPQSACYAVTYQPKKSGERVVVIRPQGAPRDGSSFEVVKRRTVLK